MSIHEQILTGAHPANTPITPSDVHQIMGAGVEYVLLDVRTQDEFNHGHIKGAVLLPVDNLRRLAPSLLPDKEALILIYCNTGNRAALAVKMLGRLGYTSIASFGGIVNWPYEVVT
ncbi:MAG: rhodanese-like domain-containing protein [Eubacteriaceae bacterium]|nr:rhodanese-like domain-containing protein [Eubacteriaceae bacterium]